MPAERPAQGRECGSEGAQSPSKGASRSLRTAESGAGRAGSGQSGSKRPENPPAEAAGQASPDLYPSENPPSTAPSSPRCWPTHAHRLAHPTVPHPLAPRPPNRHRLPTRSVATPRSHLDCRNVLILIVAGQAHLRPHRSLLWICGTRAKLPQIGWIVAIPLLSPRFQHLWHMVYAVNPHSLGEAGCQANPVLVHPTI